MSSIARLKRVLIGPSLPSSAHAEERLTRAEALAVLSSDALSSVAYATQEALIVLLIAGNSPAILGLSLPISVAIALLLAIVVMSYAQTIRAYPNGGGSYIVSRENLGLHVGLIAGTSLLIDYVLTVTVSVSAGVDNLVSAFPLLGPFSVGICVVLIFLLMLANLRGVKESGRIFMIPTYAFVFSMFLMVIMGLYSQVSGQVAIAPPPSFVPAPTEPLSLFLVLKAFSAGCTALTGVEAISNGVMIFKPPEWKNARKTLIYLGILLGTMFLGISYIAHIYQIVPDVTEKETVISMLGRQIFGSGPVGSVLYYAVQITTLLVLLLAANTSFADFPRLSSLLARDGFLPRQLSSMGDRLVFSNGIIFLSFCAAVLLILFRGSTSAIIPLYAVGVFASFTFSQAGMVRHWFKTREPSWRISAFVNGLGAVTTFVVLAVIVWTKFALGAWIVIVAIPLFVGLFLAIHHHYQYIAKRLKIQNPAPRGYIPRPKADTISHPAVVVVGGLHQGTMDALDYARSIADEIVAVHVDIGTSDLEKLQTRWRELESDIPLIILNSPYRSIVSPIVNFVTEFEQQYPNTLSTVVLPVFITRTWWESLLHNQTTFFLKAALRAKRSRVITTVGYYL